MSLSIFASEERQHSPSVFQLARLAGGKKPVDFCYLSNKFFPTPEILGKLSEDFVDSVRNYPSMQAEQCELAGRLTGYPPDRILVGNGASELIHLVAARVGKRWLMPYPSYMEYENVIRDFQKDLHLHRLREEMEFRVDIDEVLEEVERHRLDAIVLPNPNSPTGQKIPLPALQRLLEQGKSLEAIVIDESFIEFTALNRDEIPSLRSLLDAYPKLIIVRSLGKDFGVCGLRLGLVATANRSWREEIRRYLPVWNISPLAEKFLRICVDYLKDYEAARVTCIRETQALARGLGKLPGLQVFETFSNFILFKILGDRLTSTELRDYLLTELGLYVRDCSRKVGLSDRFIRVGTNRPEENRRLVEGIAGFLAGR